MAAMDGNETFLFAPVNRRHHRPFTDESGQAMDSLLTCGSSHGMPWLTKALYT